MSEARRKRRAEARELLRKLKKSRRAELAAMTPEQKRALLATVTR